MTDISPPSSLWSDCLLSATEKDRLTCSLQNPRCSRSRLKNYSEIGFLLIFDFILEKPATRPRDRCGKEQLVYPFVTGFPGSSRVSALAPYSSGGRVGSTLSTPHAGGDLGLFVGECSSPQTDAPKQRRGMSHQRPDLSSHSSCDDPRPNFQIGREARALRSDVVVVATYFYLALRGELLPVV